jgi:hypothetical protein
MWNMGYFSETGSPQVGPLVSAGVNSLYLISTSEDLTEIVQPVSTQDLLDIAGAITSAVESVGYVSVAFGLIELGDPRGPTDVIGRFEAPQPRFVPVFLRGPSFDAADGEVGGKPHVIDSRHLDGVVDVVQVVIEIRVG